jgi:glycosyltransferase involved in cell wall biosynthesis
MKILYLGNIPAPYTIEFLNELSKYCEIYAIFERRKSSERDKEWSNLSYFNFEIKILRGLANRKDTAIAPQIIFSINKSYDHILVGNPLTLTGIISILYMKIRKIKYIIISEGGIPKSGSGLKEIIKKTILRKSKIYLSGSNLGNQYFIRYGAEENLIYSYPFASMFKSEILIEPISTKNKIILREKLAIDGWQKVVLSVGRVIPTKGFENLVKVASRNRDTLFCVVGGIPYKKLQKLIEKLLISNVKFIDHVNKKLMISYYKAADLFFFPTLGDTYGLVINEAMSLGLPIITTDKCVSGHHLVEDGVNGFITGSEDIDRMSSCIVKILGNEDLRKKMEINNLKKIKNHNYEHMACKIHEILNNIE